MMASTFSTASTAATIPITLGSLQRLGVSRRSSQLTACIGTNFNNDGTALYQATAALFMAQALGYSLSLIDQVVIVLTTLVASVGAGGIPSGSFVTLPLIFAAVRLPADKIPILLTVDWFLDRCRTTSNVLGDMTVAVLLDRVAPPREAEQAAEQAEPWFERRHPRLPQRRPFLSWRARWRRAGSIFRGLAGFLAAAASSSASAASRAAAAAWSAEGRGAWPRSGPPRGPAFRSAAAWAGGSVRRRRLRDVGLHAGDGERDRVLVGVGGFVVDESLAGRVARRRDDRRGGVWNGPPTVGPPVTGSTFHGPLADPGAADGEFLGRAVGRGGTRSRPRRRGWA